jgi:hypothetical protein
VGGRASMPAALDLLGGAARGPGVVAQRDALPEAL